jgi:hypothetical protein
MIMKAWKILVSVIAMTGVAASAYAQRCACCGGPGPGNYNAAVETILTGTIDEVITMGPGGAAMGGVHLTLTTPSGVTDVHVGPTWFVTSKQIEFTKGDALTVVGSTSTMGGKSVIVAREIKKGDQVLTLRDANGFPLWSGHHRHGR